MEKIIYILKRCVFYVIGLISFSTIAFITQRIVTSILLKVAIYPAQDLYNIFNYILAYWRHYLVVYTLLYFAIVYSINKYDRYIVKKLNIELEQVKKYQRENNNGGEGNATRQSGNSCSYYNCGFCNIIWSSYGI